MKWLRNKFLNNLPNLSKTTRRRIFISREDSTRKIVNEDELFKYLETLGFEKLVMTKLSPLEQIDAFRTAEIVVLPHGAAGTHLLFVPFDCKVIELHSLKWINNCYLSICNSLGINYRWIIDPESKASFDYKIDIEKLKSCLVDWV
jgi:capsular polysaccharide biosynthesis protein